MDFIISVIDEGIGIPEERIKRLGEPFIVRKKKVPVLD